MIEVEMLLLHILEHRVLLAEHARDISVVERNELLLRKPLGILNGHLGGRSHIAGGGFTVADLNVASILAWGKIVRLDLTAWPDLKRWLDACLARPANARARAIGK
jgi:glutathione S-transferase